MFSLDLFLLGLFLLGLLRGGELSPHDPEGRLAAITARIERAPTNAALYLERGRLHAALGEPRAALADFGTTLRLEPQHREALIATAFVEHLLGNEVAALVACRRACTLGVVGPALHRLHGRVLAALNRPAEAAVLLAAAMTTSERHEPEHFLELAAALLGSGDRAAAQATLERGLASLGPVISLVDAAVALDMESHCFDRALQRLAALAPFVRRAGPLHERRARVFELAGRGADAASERQLASTLEVDDEAVVAAASVGSRVCSAPFVVGPPLPATVLVPVGSTWRYRDDGVDPGLAWPAPSFDDSGWASGPAQLGYGDGDEATIIGSGPPGAAFPTAWFRHTFSVQNPSAWTTARVRLLCDDGAVVYLNGVEIGRWNLMNGVIGAGTWASTIVSGADENTFHIMPVLPSLLVAGNNVLAVEVHQVSPNSSDVSFDLELLAGPGPISVVRRPYLQNGTPTSAVVRWRTDQPTQTKLWLGSSPTTLQSVFFDPTQRTEHAAVASGLQPETLLYYAIGDASGLFTDVPVSTLRTLPPIGAVRPVRTWVLGDSGVGWSLQYLVRDLYAAFAVPKAADAMLLLGDNAYNNGTDAEYQQGLFDVYGSFLSSTFCWSTLGNHDAASAVTATQNGPYYDIFSLPAAGEAGGLPSGTEAYYSFDRGHVHFLCLDSMDSDRSATGAMMTWLTADLASTSARWIIAFFHHPPYSFGSHNSDLLTDSGGRLIDMRQIALPILEAGGVDLVLSGHSHSYERSYLLDGHYGFSSTLQPNMVLDHGDGRVAGDGNYGKAAIGPAAHQGAVYMVAGTSAALGGGLLNHPAMCVSLNRLGSVVLDIDGDRLDATFVGFGGVEDQFTLVKGDARTLFRDQPRISVTTGGRQDYQLVAGPTHAGRLYVLAGSMSTEPGFDLLGVHIPLNIDPWLQLSLALANSSVYSNSIGLLDANGSATAALVLPPLNDPSLVGQVLYHAYVIVGGGVGFVHASNTVRMTFSP